MSNGLRFFGTDYNEISFENTITASSNDDMKDFAFDGLKSTKWISQTQNTNGTPISLEVDFGTARSLDAFYIYDTNIEDIELQYYEGSSWATLNSSVATITKSDDLKNIFIESNSTLTPTKLKIVGEDTITADQEKYVTLFHAFSELGQFEYFPEFKPKKYNYQNKFKTTDGRNILIERGESFQATLTFKSHTSQDDITLIESLIERKEPFFIWPCGGDTSIFRFVFYPFRFKDLFKIAIEGDSSPTLTKNYYKSGYNNKLKLVEVV